MSAVIWKFDVPPTDEFKLDLPVAATFLDVQVQHGTPRCWFLLDPEAPRKPRRFVVAGTGHQIDDPRELTHRGTFQLHGGDLVFHLFECGRPQY